MKVRISLTKEIDESYDIIIDRRILKRLPKELKRLKLASKYIIITDKTTKRLFGNDLLYDLRRAGIKSDLVDFIPGEKSKIRTTKAALEDEILFKGAGRDSAIIALGGGVVGDLAGFVASTLFRGIPYIQVPTTLLADVDSSIGGKTAVDHPLGKNLIGSFYQPKRVYIDVSLLKSLPEKQMVNGLAEIIKHALIMDKGLLKFIETSLNDIYDKKEHTLVKLIKRNCEIKGSIVEQDEKERGIRKIVNFGHTIGHAIENLSHYTLGHGESIAIGMVAESAISKELGLLSEEELDRIIRVIKNSKLPVKIPENILTGDIITATKLDKKARGGMAEYVLLKGIGRAVYDKKVKESIIRKILDRLR